MASNDLVMGIDLGGTSFLVAATDSRGRIVAECSKKTKPGRGFDGVVERVAETVQETIEDLKSKPRAICVGVAGSLDPAKGVVISAPNLAWTNAPLGKRLGDEVGAPVIVDNDVNVAVVGEREFGAARGHSHAVGLWVGTGIGGGVYVGGQLYRGAHGTAGELGHTVVLADGPLCPCGGRGCIEALASRTSMERDVRAALKKGRKSTLADPLKDADARMTSGMIDDALRAGDLLMGEVIDRACHFLGLFVANVANALDPEVIVIGGGIVEKLGNRYLDPIRRAAHAQLLPRRGHVKIVASELGDRAGALGACALARQSLAKKR